MSGNVNVANYCNFGSNRTTNVRVNQGPGGNSTLSLGWDNEPPKQNLRNNNNNNNNYQAQYSKGQDSQKYNPVNGNPVSAYVPQYSNPTEPAKEYGGNPYNNNRYDPGDINQYYGQQKKNDGFQPSSRASNQGQPHSYEKTSVQVSQNPGGKQSYSFGNDYNYFKDPENQKGGIGSGTRQTYSPNKPDSYNTLRNNYRNMIDQPNLVSEYQPKYSQNAYGNNGGSNNNYQQQQQPDIYSKQQYNNNNQQQQNQSRQPNNLHDVKFGYRVNQPPGGRSNITLG